VPGAARVRDQRCVGHQLHQFACPARMIQVDMSDDDVTDLMGGSSAACNHLQNSIRAVIVARLDNSKCRFGFQQIAGRHLRTHHAAVNGRDASFILKCCDTFNHVRSEYNPRIEKYLHSLLIGHDKAMAISTFHGAIQWSFLSACLLTGLLMTGPAHGDQLNIMIKGVEEPLLSNIRARTSSFRVSGNTRLSRRRLTQFRTDAERRAGSALRPYGYYHAVVSSELQTMADGSWELTLHVDKGPAVIVSDFRVDVLGPGKTDPGLQKWKAEWPLTEGSVLDQATWEEQKLAALDLAHAHGFLGAEFSEQVIKLDLEQNRASLVLLLETGEQAVMGSIVFNQDVVRPGVLENLPRFSAGQPYDEWLMEQFRLDLWRTGFFDNIEVLEERKLDESPPLVNLVANLEPRNPNTYQGSLGYGSDTGVRVQAMWSRHVLSKRGDSLDVGFGWRQRDNEFNFRTFYRYPRKVSARQYWAVELLYKTEDEKFTVNPVGESEKRTTIARGSVNDYSIKPGWIKIRGLKRGYQQIIEHWYLQYLHERSRFSPVMRYRRKLPVGHFRTLSRNTSKTPAKQPPSE